MHYVRRVRGGLNLRGVGTGGRHNRFNYVHLASRGCKRIPIDAIDRRTLVVTTEEKEIFGVFDLESQYESDRLSPG